MKTYMAKKGEITQKWHVADVSGKVLGRAAAQIATVLMGKHRPEYTPNVDTGDFVIVINASEVIITGSNKPQQRIFQSYSGYPGGRRVFTHKEMMQKDPGKVITQAVRRMLPKSKLGVAMQSKLKVYPNAEHSHQAQMPEVMEL